MKTTDFNKDITSAKLLENIEKQFGSRVNLNKYDREQLEDIRNKLRTRIFQQEGSAGVNDLLTNETYQKDKAMLELLNTRIKEMLGEQMKQLRNRIDQLNEAKKTKGSKPDFLDLNKNGDKKEPMKSAAKDAKMKEAIKKDKKGMEGNAVTGGLADKSIPVGSKIPGTNVIKKKQIETEEMKSRVIKGKSYGSQATSSDPDRDDDTPDTSSKKPDFDSSELSKVMGGSAPKNNTKGRVHKMKEGMKHAKDCDCKECMGTYQEDSHQASTTMKHIKNPTAGEKKAAKDIKAGTAGYRDRIDMLKSAEADGRLKSEGKDEGKPGKMFKKIAKDAGERYGSKEAGERVAGRIRANKAKAGTLEESIRNFKHNVRFVNESLVFLLQEDEEGKAKTITAASDMVNDFTGWMQRVGQYQTKAIIELADSIRADFGAAEAEAFKQAVSPALSATLEVLTQQRETISNAVATLAGESMPENPMGAEPDMGVGDNGALPGSEPDALNPDMGGGDDFGASDAAAGGDVTAGREMRESRQQRTARRLAEAHSIIAKLAK